MTRKVLVSVALVILLFGCGQPATPFESQTRAVDGMVQVYVPAGEFAMGSTAEEVEQLWVSCKRYYIDQHQRVSSCRRDWFAGQQPRHNVYLDAFWIDRTEVSNAQYRQCVESGVCTAPEVCGVWFMYGEGETYNDVSKSAHPVACVTWEDARIYCEWVGGRLPTEAEWEYAARGPNSYLYPWGNTLDGSLANLCDTNCENKWRATEYDDGYEQSAPVGSYPGGASWCGALDMVGNVSEWVADWYDEAYYAQSPSQNPPGPDWGYSRVIRGNSWRALPTGGDCTIRDGLLPEIRSTHFGFRCVIPVNE